MEGGMGSSLRKRDFKDEVVSDERSKGKAGDLVGTHFDECCIHKSIKDESQSAKQRRLTAQAGMVTRFSKARSLITGRRNAICETGSHDRHELCAIMKESIVFKGLECTKIH